MKGKKKYLFILLLLLGVGFAAVSTTLYINGVVNIKADTENFEKNVIFKSVSVDSDSSAAGTVASISDDGKSISLTTHKLKNIGEKVYVDYTIENKSQYMANIGELTCTSDDADWSTYLSLTEKNALNGTVLAKNSISSADRFEIEMIRSFVGTDDSNDKTFTFKCSLGVSASEAN